MGFYTHSSLLTCELLEQYPECGMKLDSGFDRDLQRPLISGDDCPGAALSWVTAGEDIHLYGLLRADDLTAVFVKPAAADDSSDFDDDASMHPITRQLVRAAERTVTPRRASFERIVLA